MVYLFAFKIEHVSILELVKSNERVIGMRSKLVEPLNQSWFQISTSGKPRISELSWILIGCVWTHTHAYASNNGYACVKLRNGMCDIRCETVRPCVKRHMRMQNTHVRQKLNLIQVLAADACVKASIGHTFLLIATVAAAYFASSCLS